MLIESMQETIDYEARIKKALINLCSRMNDTDCIKALNFDVKSGGFQE